MRFDFLQWLVIGSGVPIGIWNLREGRPANLILAALVFVLIGMNLCQALGRRRTTPPEAP